MLHGSMSAESQRGVFKPAPSGNWRIILATDIAETSITLSDVTHVVDSGLCKVLRYDPVSDMSMLCEESVSRASADQRSGRAGRVREGVCWRLYSESFYAAVSRDDSLLVKKPGNVDETCNRDCTESDSRDTKKLEIRGGIRNVAADDAAPDEVNDDVDGSAEALLDEEWTALQTAPSSGAECMEEYAVPEMCRVPLEDTILRVGKTR